MVVTTLLKRRGGGGVKNSFERKGWGGGKNLFRKGREREWRQCVNQSVCVCALITPTSGVLMNTEFRR